MARRLSITLGFFLFLPLLIQCGTGLCPFEECTQTESPTPPSSTLDAPPTFTRINAFNETVYRAIFNSDGSIYFAGSFDLAKGTSSPGLARLDSKGHFDSAFDVGLGFVQASSTAAVSSIVKTSDEDLYAIGTFDTYNGDPFKGIVRINSDGSTDSAFSVGAAFSTGGYPFYGAMALDNSGDIYVGGDFTDYDGSGAERIIRINSDGSTDSDFDVFSSGGFDANVFVVEPAIDGSGDIYVGGNFLTYGGTGLPYLARLNSDGSVDTNFDTTTGGAFNERVVAIKLLTSGQLYAAGAFTSYAGTANTFIVRLNSDGSLDTSFDADNQVNSFVWAMDIAPDGSSELLAGLASAAFTLHRLENDGTKSTKFPSAAQTTTSNILTLSVDSRGRGILLAGFPGTYGPFGGQLLMGSTIMLASDGSINTSFDLMAGADNNVDHIVHSSDGSGGVYLSGAFNGYAGVDQDRLIRLYSHGGLDTTFNTGTGFNNSVTSLAPMGTNGRLIVGGSFTTYAGNTANRIVALASDGSIDTGFNTGTGLNNLANSLLRYEADIDRTYVAGFFTSYGGVAIPHVVRLFSNGSIDSSFSPGTGFDSGVNLEIAQAPNNDIFIHGLFTSYQSNATPGGLVRINSDGGYDSQFNLGTGFTGGTILDSAVASNGDIYLVGTFTTYQGVQRNRIVRLNSDASIDSGFNVGTGLNASTQGIHFIPDGSGDLLATGSFTSYNGTAANRMIRIRTDGSLDTSFVPFVTGAFNQSVSEILAANDGSGNFFMVGSFTTFNRIPVGRVMRLDSNFNIN